MNPAQEEADFRATLGDLSLLDIPLDLDDANDVVESMQDLRLTLRTFVSRARQTYQQETWISQRLFAMCQQLEQMEDEVDQMVRYDAFPERKSRRFR